MEKNSEYLYKVLRYYGLETNNNESKFKISCPIHDDPGPSMLIDLEAGKFYCFGCNKKGYAYELIKHIEKVDDLDAWLMLFQILKIKKIKNTQFKYTHQPKISNKEALINAKKHFYSLQKKDWKYISHTYMRKRGFEDWVLNQEDVRINKSSSNYPIICPILDMNKFKGYVCRTHKKSSDRKYLYNKGFNRANVVLGNYEGPWVVVTEGYMDYLKLKQYGIENACAILGWKASNVQLSKLQKQTTTVISALDNTDTGREGTKYLSKYFKVIRFQFPENVKDVGDLNIYQFNKSWNDTLIKIRRLINGRKS